MRLTHCSRRPPILPQLPHNLCFSPLKDPMRRFLTSQQFLQHFLTIYSGILTVVFAATVLTAFRPAAATLEV